MSKPCAKDFRKPVTLKRITFVEDGGGGQKKTLVDAGIIWCSMKFKGGSEPLFADRKQTETTVEFTTRYRDDIAATDTLEYNGVSYNITSAQDVDFKNEFLIILADSGVTL